MPYIGYWQLMNAVDKYVVYDDVNYIKGGWINRNRILLADEVKYFNLPLLGASPNKLIKEVNVNCDERLIKKNQRLLENAYKKAPYYTEVKKLLDKIMWCGKTDVASYIVSSFEVICDYLDIKTELILSSSLDKDNLLKGQEKVIDICKVLGASEYYNAIGGQALYAYERFEHEGIKLKFLKTNIIMQINLK